MDVRFFRCRPSGPPNAVQHRGRWSSNTWFSCAVKKSECLSRVLGGTLEY